MEIEKIRALASTVSDAFDNFQKIIKAFSVGYSKGVVQSSIRDDINTVIDKIGPLLEVYNIEKPSQQVLVKDVSLELLQMKNTISNLQEDFISKMFIDIELLESIYSGTRNSLISAGLASPNAAVREAAVRLRKLYDVDLETLNLGGLRNLISREAILDGVRDVSVKHFSDAIMLLHEMSPDAYVYSSDDNIPIKPAVSAKRTVMKYSYVIADNGGAGYVDRRSGVMNNDFALNLGDKFVYCGPVLAAQQFLATISACEVVLDLFFCEADTMGAGNVLNPAPQQFIIGANGSAYTSPASAYHRIHLRAYTNPGLAIGIFEPGNAVVRIYLECKVLSMSDFVINTPKMTSPVIVDNFSNLIMIDDTYTYADVFGLGHFMNGGHDSLSNYLTVKHSDHLPSWLFAINVLCTQVRRVDILAKYRALIGGGANDDNFMSWLSAPYYWCCRFNNGANPTNRSHQTYVRFHDELMKDMILTLERVKSDRVFLAHIFDDWAS